MTSLISAKESMSNGKSILKLYRNKAECKNKVFNSRKIIEFLDLASVN